MILKTETIKSFIESVGYTRVEGIPYSFTGYEGANDPPIVFEEDYSYIDTDILIEDLKTQGAHILAAKIKQWVESLQDAEQ